MRRTGQVSSSSSSSVAEGIGRACCPWARLARSSICLRSASSNPSGKPCLPLRQGSGGRRCARCWPTSSSGRRPDARPGPSAAPDSPLGRHPSNDVALDSDAEVSRVHAVVELVGPSWAVRDLGSRNGTRVNGDLTSGDRLLRSGDELLVGSTRLVFRLSEETAYDVTVGADPPPQLTTRERDVLLELFRPTADPGPFNEPPGTREIRRTGGQRGRSQQHMGPALRKVRHPLRPRPSTDAPC